ncbi:DNA methyltransferase [Thioflexithrix psekupsensis]|uniref:site-specific DNA-methyltransferase (cytosine-N(4)-specific) n=1 Tax=Thioflexithrix psekupsensis TaxID=1570016 RepID=A0A251X598_9GAMM|nr:DNA methyltransferase [Thioflexithrix psekupsensis]OUD12673.1 DNA modification methylase [Thioflexithrix psekupsensis]
MKTLEDIGNINGNSTAETRWAKFGPYYAMFPIDFAFKVINEYSKIDDYILDPFAGRFSSVYAGGVLGRNSVGIEISPIGWLYGNTKLNPAPKENVKNRLLDIYNQRNEFAEQAEQMNEFFQLCYCNEVLRFLLSARENLNWRNDQTDATLMAIILVHLHGKIGEGLSNQMRQTKAMGYGYSINWWKNNGFTTPPQYNPLEFLIKKIEWRYAKNIPKIETDCQAILGDSTLELQKIGKTSKENNAKYSLLFTSPPYCSVVDYHVDQWLRLWLLKEGMDKPQTSQEKYKGRFTSKNEYRELLDKVFGACAKIMHEKSTIYVRTDIREFTQNLTIEILKSHFSNHKMKIIESEVLTRNQTEIFGNKSRKKEIDLLLTN